MSKDNIRKCPHCGSSLCYETQTPYYAQWMCFNCGYGSTSNLLNGSSLVESSRESLPELLKDLEFIDEEGFVWYPNTINIPSKGILFPNGPSSSNWHWSVAPSIELKEEEKARFPKGQTHKIDFKRMKNYPKENFSEAIVELNSF